MELGNKPVSRRRLLQLAGVSTTLGLLSACTPAAQPAAPTATTAAPKATAAPTTAAGAPEATSAPTSAPAAGGRTIELTAAMPDWLQPGSSDTLKKIKASFEKSHPNVKVVEVAIPFAQFHDQMLTQFNAESPPDVVRADEPQMPLYIEKGFVEPLDAVLKQGGLDPNSFIPAQKSTQRDGQNYGVVFISNPRAFIYNKALYEEAGVTAPKNVAEFEEAMAKTTRADRQQFGFGLATKAGDTTGLFIQLMPVVMGMGGAFFKDGKPTATDPNNIAALKLVKSLWDKGQIPRGLDAVSTNTLIYQGKVASTVSGAFILFQAKATDPNVAKNLDTAPSPFPAKTGMHASAYWVLPKKAKNKDLGAEYILEMLKPESQKAIVQDQGAFPARPGYVTDEYLKANPWFKVFADASSSSVSYVPLGVGAKAFDGLKIVGGAVEQVLYQNKSPENAMADAQKELERLFT